MKYLTSILTKPKELDFYNLQCSLLSPSAVPDAPGTPDATHITGDSITLCWTRPRSDGGNEIKHYILERREKKSLQWVKVSSKRPITELRHRATRLTEGYEYEFRVMAENGAGIGPASGTSRLFKCREPTSTPSAPTVIKVGELCMMQGSIFHFFTPWCYFHCRTS